MSWKDEVHCTHRPQRGGHTGPQGTPGLARRQKQDEEKSLVESFLGFSWERRESRVPAIVERTPASPSQEVGWTCLLAR